MPASTVAGLVSADLPMVDLAFRGDIGADIVCFLDVVFLEAM